jgi:serine phosphatase RsbU (regulator of sigma subunit)
MDPRKAYRFVALKVGGFISLIAIGAVLFSGSTEILVRLLPIAFFLGLIVSSLAGAYYRTTKETYHLWVAVSVLIFLGAVAAGAYAIGILRISSLREALLVLATVVISFVGFVVAFGQAIKMNPKRKEMLYEYNELVHSLHQQSRWRDLLKAVFVSPEQILLNQLPRKQKILYWFSVGLVSFNSSLLYLLILYFTFKAKIVSTSPVVSTGILLGGLVIQLGPLLLQGLFKIAYSEKQRVEGELRVARTMQAGLMPASDPVVEGFDISGLSKPSEEVGGDYFDYLWMNEEKTKLGIAIADVSGKAMKAAITAVMTSGMIYREIGSNQSPKEILKRINTPMFLKTQKNTFTAMSIAVIDTKAKTLTLSNAGQTHPILKRGETTRFLKVEGTHYPLGIIEEVEYQELRVPLQSGDLIVFYTDGIAEATNTNKELFGFDRLEQKVKQITSETARETIQAIVGEAEKFAGSAKQHDDMTVVAVRVR